LRFIGPTVRMSRFLIPHRYPNSLTARMDIHQQALAEMTALLGAIDTVIAEAKAAQKRL
jgi:hypothetical protein